MAVFAATMFAFAHYLLLCVCASLCQINKRIVSATLGARTVTAVCDCSLIAPYSHADTRYGGGHACIHANEQQRKSTLDNVSHSGARQATSSMRGRIS